MSKCGIAAHKEIEISIILVVLSNKSISFMLNGTGYIDSISSNITYFLPSACLIPVLYHYTHRIKAPLGILFHPNNLRKKKEVFMSSMPAICNGNWQSFQYSYRCHQKRRKKNQEQDLPFPLPQTCFTCKKTQHNGK